MLDLGMPFHTTLLARCVHHVICKISSPGSFRLLTHTCEACIYIRTHTYTHAHMTVQTDVSVRSGNPWEVTGALCVGHLDKCGGTQDTNAGLYWQHFPHWELSPLGEGGHWAKSCWRALRVCVCDFNKYFIFFENVLGYLQVKFTGKEHAWESFFQQPSCRHSEVG